jgi:hypothetical protein
MNILNDLDKELKKELLSDFPKMDYIEFLLSKGANINFPVYDEGNNNILDELIFPIDFNGKTNTELIKFCINKGVNVNYIDPYTGFNHLFDACQSLRPDVFELLLQYGANPNCISNEQDEMALSCWINKEINFLTIEKQYSDLEKYEYCDKLIKKYGGKRYYFLNTKKIKKYIIVCSKYKTGLVTWDGNINIKDITKNKKLRKIYYEWKKYKYNKFGKKDIPSFEEFINKGLIIAKYLKEKYKIKVLYHYEDIENNIIEKDFDF